MGAARASPTRWCRRPSGYIAYAKWVHGEGGRSTRAPAGSRRPGSTGPSVIGLARSAGWLSMYVGLPWALERAAALAAGA